MLTGNGGQMITILGFLVDLIALGYTSGLIKPFK